MKIRYPGPAVPAERRNQPEYASLYELPLPVGEVVEAPEAAARHLAELGMVELIDEAPPAPAPELQTESAPEAAAVGEETSERPARRRGGRNEERS